jgi:hypothetical protein
MEKNFRYPGIKPFTVSERNQFFGRDEDISKLCQLLLLEDLIVLFGKSGNGKSSLLNAGVLPEFEKDNLIIPVRFGAYIEGEKTSTPLKATMDKLLQNTKPNSFIYKKLVPFVDVDKNHLWYCCKNIQIQEEKFNSIILVFDQFEELFSYPEGQINIFKQEIADLLYLKIPQELRDIIRERLEINRDYLTNEENQYLNNVLNIKVLISIRQDKISGLNQLTDAIPRVLNKCFELKPLTEEQAKEAIIRPARISNISFLSEPFEFSYDAVDKIIDELSGRRKQPIETFQLQIVCQYSENIIIKNKGKNRITDDDLGEIKDIHKRFYDNLIAKLDISNEQRQKLRKLLEEQFIYEQEKRRLQVFKGRVEEEISEDTLLKLERTHLIRSEPYQDSFTYELSHDTLVEPILESCRQRRQQEKTEEEKRLKEEEIRIIREKNRRQRRFIAYVSVAALFALALAAFGIWQWRESIAAKKDIEKTLKNLKKSEFSKTFSEAENMAVVDFKYDDAIILLDSCYKYASDHSDSVYIRKKREEFLAKKKDYEYLVDLFIEIDRYLKSHDFAKAMSLCNQGLQKSSSDLTLQMRKQQIQAEIKIQIQNKETEAESARDAGFMNDFQKLKKEIDELRGLLE